MSQRGLWHNNVDLFWQTEELLGQCIQKDSRQAHELGGVREEGTENQGCVLFNKCHANLSIAGSGGLVCEGKAPLTNGLSGSFPGLGSH